MSKLSLFPDYILSNWPNTEKKISLQLPILKAKTREQKIHFLHICADKSSFFDSYESFN